MADVVVHAHYRTLLDAGEAYDARLEELLTEHFGGEPWERLPRLSARHAFTGPDRPRPQPLLQRLCDLDAAGLAERALRGLTAMLPPPSGRIACHIVPSLTQAMGGCSYAPGKMVRTPRLKPGACGCRIAPR